MNKRNDIIQRVAAYKNVLLSYHIKSGHDVIYDIKLFFFFSPVSNDLILSKLVNNNLIMLSHVH
jgi:hypothetical protein